MLGGSGDDSILVSAGSDTLDGGNGNDTINGLDGNDIINGGSGYEVLGLNDFGDDVLTGGEGLDQFDLFEGNDVVRYTSTLDSESGQGDIIQNFDGDPNGGQDRFDLDALFDSVGVATVDRAGLVSLSGNHLSVLGVNVTLVGTIGTLTIDDCILGTL